MHPGHGAGLPDYRLGERGGTPTQTLNTAQIPPHTHGLAVRDDDPNTSTPDGAFLANSPTYAAGVTSNANMNAGAIQNTGGGQSFSIQNPFCCVNFIIALVGLFPSRN